MIARSARFLRGGIEITKELRREMDRVRRESEEAFKSHEWKGWFDPEYLAFIERGVHLSSAFS